MDANVGGLMTIDRLTDNNFHTLKEKVPIMLSFRHHQSLATSKPPPADRVAVEGCEIEEQTAMDVITMSLSGTHLGHIKGKISAPKMWQCLMDAFEKHTPLNNIIARREFLTLTMGAVEFDLQSTNCVLHLSGSLKSMGEIIDDAKLAMITLKGVPAWIYGRISAALDALVIAYKNDFTLPFAFVKSRLLQDEQWMNVRVAASFT